MDAALFSAINSAHAPWLDTVMLWATWLGYFPGIWFLGAVAMLLVARLRAAAWRMCLAVSLTYALTSGVVKPVIGRERPYVAGVAAARTVETQPAIGPSFPSGHAATAVAGAVAGARVLPGAGWLLWTLASLMAYSRVYVGVHYPSDVAAGALFGFACASLVIGGRHRSTLAWPADAQARAPSMQFHP